MIKRLWPLLFLVPSVALMVYAKRDRSTEAEPTRVRVETGDFTFPADVLLVVEAGSSSVAPVRDGWAELVLEGEATVTLQLRGTGLKGSADPSVPIGKPQEFDPGSRSADELWVLTVTPEECRAALAQIRR